MNAQNDPVKKYTLPDNVPQSVLRRLEQRIITLAIAQAEKAASAALSATFASKLIEALMRSLRHTPISYRSETDYLNRAERRFLHFWKTGAAWERSSRGRSSARFTAIETLDWEALSSGSETGQKEGDPAEALRRALAPSLPDIIRAFEAEGFRKLQIIAWLLWRWEGQENYAALRQRLQKEAGEDVAEATLRRWEVRYFRDETRMIKVYRRITDEAPTPDMIRRLRAQGRFSPSRRAAPARKNDCPCGLSPSPRLTASS